MRLDGIHHVTCITGDARRNLDFYTGTLGLRLLTKAVNQDDVFVYHLFFGDEHASPGADLTFFEYKGAVRGRPGAGMVHRVLWRVASEDALAFWRERLAAAGVATTAGDAVERSAIATDASTAGRSLRFADPEGLEHELVIARTPDAPLVARHPRIPADLALQGFAGVRAYARRAERSRALLEQVMSATALGDDTWEVRGATRGSTIAWDPAPAEPGRQGAGSVHHVAWGVPHAEHAAWVERLHAAGHASTDVIDRHWFHSIYFREPNGVLFEIADDAPGFTVDTPLADLGKRIELPPWLEPRRAEIESHLTPLPDPRADW